MIVLSAYFLFIKVIKVKVIYNSLFNYFLHNKLFTYSESGFLPEDSCVAQLLSTIHKMQSAFDDNPTANARETFLDSSKVFDKI